jgi:multiple sugar transport system permease protein
MMAVALIMLLPILVLFFLAQRQFVQGIVMTGIKG